MKVYQLCFPDGDGYPTIPYVTWANVPSIEDLNSFFLNLFNKYKNDKRYKKELNLIQITNREYQQLVFGKGLQIKDIYDYSGGNALELIEVDVIENIPTMG